MGKSVKIDVAHELKMDNPEECQFLFWRSLFSYHVFLRLDTCWELEEWFYNLNYKELLEIYHFYKIQLQCIGHDSKYTYYIDKTSVKYLKVVIINCILLCIISWFSVLYLVSRLFKFRLFRFSNNRAFILLLIISYSGRNAALPPHLQKDILLYISGVNNKRYLLKSHIHLMALDVLMEVFPDANLIFTYRRLTDMVASFASLIYKVTKIFIRDQ